MLLDQLIQSVKELIGHYQGSNNTELYRSVEELQNAARNAGNKDPISALTLLNVEVSECSYIENLVIKNCLLLNILSEHNKLRLETANSLVKSSTLLLLDMAKNSKFFVDAQSIDTLLSNLHKIAVSTFKKHKLKRKLDVETLNLLSLLGKAKTNNWQMLFEQNLIKRSYRLLLCSYGRGKTTRTPLYQLFAEQEDTRELSKSLTTGTLIQTKDERRFTLVSSTHSTMTGLQYDASQRKWMDQLDEIELDDCIALWANYKIDKDEFEKLSLVAKEPEIVMERTLFSGYESRLLPTAKDYEQGLTALEQERQQGLFDRFSDDSVQAQSITSLISLLMPAGKQISTLKHAYAISGASNFINAYIACSMTTSFNASRYSGHVNLSNLIHLTNKLTINIVKTLKQDKALEFNLVVIIILLSICSVPRARFAITSHRYTNVGAIHQFFAQIDPVQLTKVGLGIAKQWGCSPSVLYRLQHVFKCNENNSYKLNLTVPEERAVNLTELAFSLMFDMLAGHRKPHFFHLSQLIELDIPDNINPQTFYQQMFESVNPVCSLE